MRPTARLAPAALLLLPAPALAAGASAPVSYRLEVERAPEASECPDERGLVDRLGKLLGSEGVREATGEPDTTVRVRLSRSGAEYVGVIRARGLRAGERTLRSPVPPRLPASERCASFAQALAVSLAILLDPDPSPEPSPEPAGTPAARLLPKLLPVSPAPKDAPGPVLGDRPRGRRDVFPRFGFELWGLQSGAVLNTGAFGVAGLLDARVSRWFSVAGGVLWLPQDRAQFGTGALQLSLVSALAEACLTPFEVRHFRAFVCADGAVGALTGQGRGYDTNHSATLLWGALGGTVGVDTELVGPLSLVGRVTLLVPVESRAFVVLPAAPDAGTTGDAFRTRPAGVLAGFGLRLTVP